MKLKTVEKDGTTYAEVKDGNPVYIGDDGKEVTYDAPAMHTSIGRLNREAQSHREAKEAAETKLQVFEGLDPEKARKALDVVKNLDDKKLIDAGEVDRIKQETAKSYQKQIEERDTTIQGLTSKYASEKINAAFAGSKFVKDRLAIPSDMAQAAFGKHFKFDNGRITPVDENEQPIYSDSNPGDVAGFDEALEKLVGRYPHRDSILKGTGHNGSGGDSPAGGGARTVSRSQFEGMPAHEQQKMAAAARKGEIKITD